MDLLCRAFLETIFDQSSHNTGIVKLYAKKYIDNFIKKKLKQKEPNWEITNFYNSLWFPISDFEDDERGIPIDTLVEILDGVRTDKKKIFVFFNLKKLDLNKKEITYN
jgi:hypothetical protein